MDGRPCPCDSWQGETIRSLASSDNDTSRALLVENDGENQCGNDTGDDASKDVAKEFKHDSPLLWEIRSNVWDSSQSCEGVCGSASEIPTQRMA